MKKAQRILLSWIETIKWRPIHHTRWRIVYPEKLTGSKLVKKFPAFYGTRRFITAFTSARNLSLHQPGRTPVHTPTTHFLKTHLNITLSSKLGPPKWSLSLRFPRQNLVYASPLAHTRFMPRPSHRKWRSEFLNKIWFNDNENLAYTKTKCTSKFTNVMKGKLIGGDSVVITTFACMYFSINRTQNYACYSFKKNSRYESVSWSSASFDGFT